MIRQFASTITSFLLNENIIEQEDQEIYRFGTERMIKNVIIIVLIGTVATICHAWVETIFVIIGFLPLRRVVGGYHAGTLLRCNVLTITIYLVNLVIIRLVRDYMSIQFFTVICGVTVLLIFKYAPVDHRNFVFTKERTEKAKKVGKLIVFLIVIISSGYNYIEGMVEPISLSVVMGAFSASVSVFTGSKKRRGEKDEEISIST